MRYEVYEGAYLLFFALLWFYEFVLQFWQLLEKHVGISMSCQDTGGSIEYC